MSSPSSRKIIRVNTDVAAKTQKHMFFEGSESDGSSDGGYSSASDGDVYQETLDLRGMHAGGAGEVEAPPEPAAPAPAPPTPPPAATAPQQQQQQQRPARRDFPGLDWLENHDILYNVLKYYLLSSQSRDSDKRVNIVDAILLLNASVTKLNDEFARLADGPMSLTPSDPPPAAAQPPL